MPELTDAQKVNREITQKRIAAALETLAENSEAPIGLGMTGATVGQVPVVKTVDANGVPTSYEPGAGSGGGLPAGGTDDDVLVKDGATVYSAKWTPTPKQMGSIATIETSPVTQKQLYNRGDYLVYNGTLYRTQEQVSAGQTLTPGGNIVAATVMDSKADKSATIPAVRFFDSGNTTQRTLHIPNAARFMLAIASSSSAYMGLWLGLSFSGGAVQPLVDVKGQSGYTFAYGTNTLTITTDSRQLEFCIWLLDGNNTDDYYII